MHSTLSEAECQPISLGSVAAWRREIERRLNTNPLYYLKALHGRGLLDGFLPDANVLHVLWGRLGTWPSLRRAARLVDLPIDPTTYGVEYAAIAHEWEPPEPLDMLELISWIDAARAELSQTVSRRLDGRLSQYRNQCGGALLRALGVAANDNSAQHQVVQTEPEATGWDDPLPSSNWGCTVLERGNGQRIEVARSGMKLVTERTDPSTKKTMITRAPITYSPVSIYSMTTPADPDGSAGLLVKLRNDDGRERVLPLPAEYVFENGNALVKWLRRHGVRTERKRIDDLLNYFAAGSSKKRVVSHGKTGWHTDPNGHRVFVMGDAVIGAATESVFLPSDPTATARVSSAGSLTEWRDHVAKPACTVLGWRFGLCVAFVAPLLYLLDETSVFFHLSGRTTTGKTLGQRIAASVYGRGTKSDDNAYLRTWNNTGNAVEGEAAAFCDMLLVLDELGEADGAVVGNVVYMLSDGAGRGRMKSDASMRSRRRWRIAVLSSGEVSIESKIKESGKRVAGGMGVRALELDGAKLLSPVDGAKAIETAATRCYGTAGPAFIHQLVQRGYATPGHANNVGLRSRVDSIVSELTKGMDDTRVTRAARSFAMAAAAGELAVTFGIVPAELEPLETARAAFNVWCEGNGASTVDDALMAARRLVGLVERELGASIFGVEADATMQKPGRPRLGWVSGDDVYILQEPLETALAGYATRDFLAVAARRGAFSRGDGKNLQAKVPHGNGARAFRFSLNALREWAE
jgi:putative DNA primase/helicase